MWHFVAFSNMVISDMCVLYTVLFSTVARVAEPSFWFGSVVYFSTKKIVDVKNCFLKNI